VPVHRVGVSHVVVEMCHAGFFDSGNVSVTLKV
jgi:hypothetical protein